MENKSFSFFYKSGLTVRARNRLCVPSFINFQKNTRYKFKLICLQTDSLETIRKGKYYFLSYCAWSRGRPERDVHRSCSSTFCSRRSLSRTRAIPISTLATCPTVGNGYRADRTTEHVFWRRAIHAAGDPFGDVGRGITQLLCIARRPLCRVPVPKTTPYSYIIRFSRRFN